MRHPASAFFLLAATTLALPLTTAAQKPQEPGQEALASFYGDPSWRELLSQEGAGWHVDWCPATGTPRAIWGSGIALADWRENSLEEARRQALLLLQERGALLRLGISDFREVTGARMGRSWAFVFDQYFRGLPVIGGRADVRVHMTGRVPMFGSTAWQIPADFDTTPAFDGDTALAIAWQAMATQPSTTPQPAAVAPPRLVVWGDVEATTPAPFFLAWEVAVSNIDKNGDGPIGRYYVDARSGAVLHFQNDKHRCGPGCRHTAMPVRPTADMLPVLTTVTVMAWTRTGLDATSALVNAPMPGLQLSVPGIGAVTTDQNGQFQINISSPVSISVGNLDGRHHGVIAGSNAPSGSFTVNPGVNTTIQLLTSGASSQQAAHTTTSWWVDKTNEFCRSVLGNTAQLNTADNVVPTVNINDTCNAFYSGNTINFYLAGGGCNNSAFSTVIAHEWGHGLDDRYGGISQTNGLSEGWGDIVALYLVDNPILGSGFDTPGVGIRNGNNTRQYPTGSGVHDQGESWMGFAWKFRDRLATTLGNRPAAITISNDIVLGSIVADATNQADAVIEVFVADDNDGNLANGTPHSADLIWACNQHSLPYPGQSSNVPNDDCANAIALVNGVNGPFSNTGALTSAPAWPCTTATTDVWFTFGAASSGTLLVETCNQATWDTAIQIFSGSCASLTSIGCNDDACGLRSSLSVPVTPGTYYIRVGGYNGANGTFNLNVNGPGGVLATTAPFGVGCYSRSKAFYESFTGTGFDLGSSSMRLVRTGNTYLAQPGGSYVAPSGSALQLSLTDDSAASVALTGTLSYPGGTTTSLQVNANGFVSVAAGNPEDYTPTAGEWLASTQARWGTWHDFNPTASGSGKVKFEQIGNIAYVTWDAVYSWNTTNANTWQLQFDLTNGNVTYVWQTMVASGSAWIVGFANATPNADLGSRDISATLPGTFLVGPDNMVPMSLTTSLPQIGTTLVLTTTQFPAGASVGAQILGLTRADPGIDLSGADMPGCRLFCSLDLIDAMSVAGSIGTYNFPIPNDLSLMNVQLTAQSAALISGYNVAGIVASNGAAMTLGL
ncbi:MAG: hypothetical protein JNM25_02955 [Planctomycetes bacterium]|nr:hypothetical protein [Planctomycetota bacterium]